MYPGNFADIRSGHHFPVIEIIRFRPILHDPVFLQFNFNIAGFQMVQRLRLKLFYTCLDCHPPICRGRRGQQDDHSHPGHGLPVFHLFIHPLPPPFMPTWDSSFPMNPIRPSSMTAQTDSGPRPPGRISRPLPYPRFWPEPSRHRPESGYPI